MMAGQVERLEGKTKFDELQGTSGTHSVFDIANVSQDALFWLLLIKLGQKDPKAVERILISLFNSIGSGLNAFCRAGSSNRISAWGSAKLMSLVMERWGWITQEQAAGYAMGLNIITGAEVAEEFTAMLPWRSLKPDIDFPTTVVLGDTRIVRERPIEDLIALEIAKKK